MVGAGQLARMTHQAAIPLGPVAAGAGRRRRRRRRAASPPTSLVGDYRSLEDLRAFAVGCDVVTFDHEHVPNEHIAALEADGVAVHPGVGGPASSPRTRRAMRARLAELGVPCPRWAPIASAPTSSPRSAPRSAGRWCSRRPAAGTTARASGSSDRRTRRPTVLASGTPLLAEEKVAIVRELAAVVARSPFGQGAAWPVVETVQRDGICVEVIAPAPDLDDELAEQAQALALRDRARARRHRRAGRRAVRDRATALLVNELAMRPHNSAHWTIEGSVHLAVRAAPARGARLPARRHRAGRAGDGDGEPAGRPGRRRAQGHRRAGAPLLRPLAGRQDPPLRQAVPARPQGRARDRARRRPRRRRAARAGEAAALPDGRRPAEHSR